MSRGFFLPKKTNKKSPTALTMEDQLKQFTSEEARVSRKRNPLSPS